jgi:tRNA(Ile)-lysidine synthase
MPITSTLTAFFRRPGINPSSILAGVSGGADSVALVSLLHHYREELGIERLAIAHVNHGLRGEESDGDEEFVKNLSARLDIDFYRTLLHPDPENTGIEDWARRHRYDFFRSVAKDHGFAHIATAHTANDQAETVLMRLMRGTGVRGLRGVLPVRGDGVIRPLLEVERQELLEWLGARGLTFRED